MQRNVLIGNGINIQFGGKDYLNSAIISRLNKNLATPGRYKDVFKGTVDSDILENIILGLYDWAETHIFKGLDSLRLISNQDELANVIRMCKEYSERTDDSAVNIGMEDYLLLMKLFDEQYPEKERVYDTALQGLCWLFLDALYNEGKIQEIYNNMGDVEKWISGYDNIFTVNYDTNIDKIVNRKVFHLHGSFEILYDEYDPTTLKGWILQKQNGSLQPYVHDKKYLYCNAVLGYSGDDKWRKITQYNKVYENTKALSDFIPDLKKEPYPFDDFKGIRGELDIIGMNPNNDSHIFKMINDNIVLSKVTYYYYDRDEKQATRVKQILNNKNVELIDVRKLWNKK